MKIQGEVILKKGREASVKRFHPWIFSGAIFSRNENLKDGDWVLVRDAGKKILGAGHFQNGTISVRALSFSDQPPTEDLYVVKVAAAIQQRLATRVINLHTNCYRLIHGEGDGLPGLIIDVYNGVAVIQAHSTGMHRDRAEIASAVQSVLGEAVKAIYYKNQGIQAEKAQSEYLLGMSQVPHVVLEHGHKFYVDWEEGQKTGFFLDQRENRKLLGEMSAGFNVLNTFCYTGGFSVYALKGGALRVDSVDASERAIGMTEKNLSLNGYDAVQNKCIAMDTFEFIKDKKDEYDLIILDPPAFAKHKDARHQAMKGYQRLNAEAFRIVKPNGIVFTFSCSQVVDRQLFQDTIVSSAIQAGREIQILHHLSQPADHPVSIFHPEGEYLKGLVLYVR